jgi:polyisoprenoid-binding protein YceI
VIRRAAALLGWIGALQLAASPALAATEWVVDAARSRLEFTATLAGGRFDGQFTRFRPRIAFDPDELAGSRFEVAIETGSADTGDPERDAILAGGDFFAADRWPTARFEAERFTSPRPGEFEALGRLTIRDVTRDVTISFTFAPGHTGGPAELAGGTRIRRLDFGVGQGEWRDTQWVGDDVEIRFQLFLQRK